MRIRPPRLKPGDLIGIVAPASNVRPQRLSAGIAELHRLGFRTKAFDSILEKHLYTAGTDKRRAREMNEMFADPDVKAIFAARGGYGSVRVLPLLERDMIGAKPKIVMGYSDISTLHLFFQRMFNWVVFHGPMVTREIAGGEPHYDKDFLLRVLCQPEPAGAVDTAGTRVLHPGVASGMLVGGCLPMLISSLGTPYEPESRGTILFIEDHGSKPYQVDRMIHHLRAAGKFDGIRGLIFGEMTGCIQHPKQGYTIVDVIQSCLHELNLPVLFGLRSGDSDRRNLVLPLGVEVTLDCSRERGVLSIDEAAVSD